jgi:hypothetical protein
LAFSFRFNLDDLWFALESVSGFFVKKSTVQYSKMQVELIGCGVLWLLFGNEKNPEK